MIPAILSCIYVVYLYQTLNRQPESPEAKIDNEAASDQTEELVARLRSLQSRIESLVQQSDNGGQRS